MTAVWFLMMTGWMVGGIAVLWKVAAVVLEVLREPLPASLRTDAPALATRVPWGGRSGAGPATPPIDDGVALFTSSRSAARTARPDPAAERRHAPVVEHRHDPAGDRPADRSGTGTYAPMWSDLIAQTLRELETTRN